jgi:hypothetical protein
MDRILKAFLSNLPERGACLTGWQKLPATSDGPCTGGRLAVEAQNEAASREAALLGLTNQF